jgi:hypothetical protein
MITAICFVVVTVAAFAFGYHTGYDKGRDDEAFRRVVK